MMRWIAGLRLTSLCSSRPGDVAVDHVRVGAVAADVLADLVDDQHVDPLARQPADPLARDLEQLLFAVEIFGPGTASIMLRWP